MPRKAEAIEVTQASGELEAAHVCLISELEDYMVEVGIDDGIVVIVPDTGKFQFKGSHAFANGDTNKDGTPKMTKAVGIVAQIGSDRAGERIKYFQGGDLDRVPLSLKMSLTAILPNADGVTLDEALNRKVETVETETLGAIVEAATLRMVTARS